MKGSKDSATAFHQFHVI